MLARILVVDDSPTIRRVVETALQQRGFAVTALADGFDALTEARALDPDVMLLDFLMPGVNGYQVMKAFAADEHMRDVPIVLMATRTDQIPEEGLKGLGVVDVLHKPFSPDDLVTRIEAVITKHGVRAREETTPILGLPSDLGASGEGAKALAESAHAGSFTNPLDGALQAFAGGRDIDESLAAAAAFSDLLRVLGDALYARGIDDADTLATAVCNQVRSGLSAALLAELVKRELGSDALRRPIPSLYGDLSVVALPEVLQLLKFQGQTGILEVALDQERFEILFRDGRVASIRARNATASEKLGHYFVAQGALTAEKLSRILSESDGRPIGQRLLDDGLINQKSLRDAIAAQAQDLMFEMLRAKDGVFGLRRGEDLVQAGATPGLSVDEILFEALRRVDEASVFRKEVPSLSTRFARAKTYSEEGLTSDELEIVRAIPANGSCDGRAIRASTGKSEHVVEKILYRLVVLTRIVRDDGAPSDNEIEGEAP